MRKKVLLVANPVAGGGARHRIRRAKNYLRSRGCHVDMVLTSSRGDAVEAGRRAASGEYDCVIAAGGDGTHTEVLNGLGSSQIPLAFLPFGTTNVLALEAGIPINIEGACDLALEAEAVSVCVGMINEDRFLLMAGIGFDGEVVCNVDTALKRRIGKGAYVVSALRSFFKSPPSPVEVEFEDGSSLRGYGLVVSNARYYGGRFCVTPGASLWSDSLDGCLFLKSGRFALLRYAAKLFLGFPFNPEEAYIFKTSSLKVKGERVAVQTDGDFSGFLPVELKALPLGARLILPGKV